MKLSMLPILIRTNEVREQLLRQLEAIADPHWCKLAVTIDGERLDDAAVMLVRPMICGELRGRLRSIDRDLEAMGVDPQELQV